MGSRSARKSENKEKGKHYRPASSVILSTAFAYERQRKDSELLKGLSSRQLACSIFHVLAARFANFRTLQKHALSEFSATDHCALIVVKFVPSHQSPDHKKLKEKQKRPVRASVVEFGVLAV